MVLRYWKWLSGLVLLLLCVLVVGFLIITDAFRSDDRLTLQPQRSYSQSSYLAYVQPWGAQQYWLGRVWGARSDKMRLDLKAFPDRTRIEWRWPPFGPRNGVGVWGYNHIAYGDYDGGIPLAPVKPMRVRDIKRLQSTHDWDGEFGYGQATVLMEFFLRSNPEDSDSKVLEIGWFLHFPERSQEFVAGSREIGVFTDPQGRDWLVAIDETFCTFSLKSQADLPKGSVDVLAALRWLQAKGLVKGDEWLTGLALGAEPIKGVGHVEVRHWAVDWE